MKVRVKKTSVSPLLPSDQTFKFVPKSGSVPMAHQQNGIKYGLQRDHVAFFYEMRLGKTKLTVWWVQAMAERGDDIRHCVVIAPLTVLEAWENELTAEGETFVRGYGLDAEERLRRIKLVASTTKGRRWILCNYEMIRLNPIIARMPWDVVVLDEATKIKTATAQITKLCTKQFRGVRHRAILTGLPNPESELDMFCQFQFLHGSFADCSNYWEYRMKYFRQNAWSGRWEIKPECRIMINELTHAKASVMTRAKAGMGSRKIHEYRKVQMTPTQRKLYKQVERDFEAHLSGEERPDGESLEKITNYAIVAATWMARIAGGFDPDGVFLSPIKKDELLSLLLGDLRDEKVVVWFRFRNELEYALSALREAGIRATSIHGGVPMGMASDDGRISRLQRFRDTSASGVRVLCCTESIKYGIDCSVADTAIYYSHEWSGEAYAQSQDRIIHPKKNKPALYVHLVTEGTVDEDVVKAVQDKLANAQLFMTRFKDLYQQRKSIKRKGSVGRDE